MNLKLMSLCLLALGSATRPVPSRPQMTCDPNDPEKTRAIVSRQEREKLGLTPKTWTGIVHPDVYPRFDRLEQTVASLKERVKRKDERAFLSLSGIRFPGMVYVQVQLKDRDAQRRVLRSLKASEIHAPYLFEKAPGLIGYVTREGLDKLAKHPDVTGVCLDDKPLLEPDPIIPKDILPPPKPGDTYLMQPGVKEGKVDPDVYRAFDLSCRVMVMVNLRGESLPDFGGGSLSEMRAQNELREQAERQLQDRVLSTITADDCWVSGKRGPSIRGSITKGGLQELWGHPDVLKIVLPWMIKLPEYNIRSK